jgi:hypothetical protein
MSAASKEISYVISLSVCAGCYRHIKISSKATLYQLHKAILDAFEFDDDHAHAFFMDDSVWSDKESFYANIIEDEERHTAEYKLEQLGLCVGKKFKYLFDFGDEWRFQCKVLKVLDEKTKMPEIIRSKGEAPSQYGYEFDDEELDEDE